jgi:putative transposase
MDDRRAWHAGGAYFFTVHCLQRKQNDLLIRHMDHLKRAISTVKKTHPFKIHAWLVLPEHMHSVIELPEGDSDFATRWRLIKMLFSRVISKDEFRSEVRKQRRERGIWQRRYWEHLIRDDANYQAHMD